MVDTKPTAQQLSAASAPAGRSRGRGRHANQDEDATKLQFGEFSGGEALTIGEVQTLLEISRQGTGAPPPPDNNVYKQTVEYVKEFTNVKPGVAESMRQTLQTTAGDFLNTFEVAQIMYLRPENIEVAVSLIPSLERYANGDADEDKLLHLLQEVRSLARIGA
ncbi:uncharacterized protein CcaverHIS019_0103640 [Cutaneotrichosporon cavernicola]|uniref:RNA polymerase Rpb4/RPC9 core domain-containing protein n=1 Tax=Cutaneotrichosporon cavernicola TaxID=279322 RepID=A0AA48IB89_9TREE|nr:uncharacterized protein CcaverHIS019_0103640 [Cutaneotrichosporon cavernicola]BEI87646.1 hypothetical protein CcaverHIS019_0103640 [Cutaneotrichosporon cavernicola]BEI95418.1 hypothetical protein CcaverHIS631_0103670 [Cutaneotrichosporon cavernicola]BEJ03192.1 hypothetical protein CcaverHIS641_0103670 [Cutaneotrichosporon cavernicola]